MIAITLVLLELSLALYDGHTESAPFPDKQTVFDLRMPTPYIMFHATPNNVLLMYSEPRLGYPFNWSTYENAWQDLFWDPIHTYDEATRSTPKKFPQFSLKTDI